MIRVAVVHKGGPARELFEGIRRVAGGGDAMPPVSPHLYEAAGQALDPEDLPILGMLLDRAPSCGDRDTLRLEAADLRDRVDRMLRRLKVPVPSVAP